jgi:hypothetical protein
VPFEIMGLTFTSYVEWTILIGASVDGRAWKFAVTLPDGGPIPNLRVRALSRRGG